jgi:putative transcriptional regulator
VPLSEPDLSQLRQIINVRRAEAGLTLEQLAEVSGVSRQTILNLSSGKYHGDLRTWLRLSKAFGVGLDELLADVWLAPGSGG